MSFISRRIQRSLTPSATLAQNARVYELKTAGVDIVNFTVGEPDWFSPEIVKETGISAIRENKTFYTPAAGTRRLREKVASYYAKEWRVPAHHTNVLISNGGKQILAMLFAILLDEGDEVLIPSPYWTSYPEQVKYAGGVPVYVETNKDYSVNTARLQEKISSRTKIIILNSPSNPTGAITPKNELRNIVELAKEHNLLIISDEVYGELYFGEKPCSIASLEQTPFSNVVIASSVSKMSSMTGWRIGFGLAQTEIINALESYQSHFSSAPLSPV